MATAHLIHGYLGAGKTTVSLRLAEQVGGVRLSRDEWYLRLYTDGEPTERLEDVWLARLSAVLDDHWPELLARGVDVILDFGFWGRAERNEARRRADLVGGDVVLYELRCDGAIARERCLRRHVTGSFRLDSAAFDALRRKFEPLGEDEPRTEIDTTPRGRERATGGG